MRCTKCWAAGSAPDRGEEAATTLYLLDLLGVAVFAVSGAQVAEEARLSPIAYGLQLPVFVLPA